MSTGAPPTIEGIQLMTVSMISLRSFPMLAG
jgi:hypothetical protein